MHGPAVDQILAIETASSGAVLWALSDHLGSVRDIVDNSGTVANTLSMTRLVMSQAKRRLLWISYLDLPDASAMKKRSELSPSEVLQPAIGRWLSEDPIGFGAGDTNLRRYVNNNPVNFTDPTGHSQSLLLS